VTAQRRAEAERRAMLEFLSHDMRGPQVAILGLAEGEGAASGDGLTRIGALARRTLDLADNFVRLARLDHAAPDLHPVDLAALADEAADRSWPQARAAGVRVECHHAGESVPVESDPDLLARVLDNLIGNAVKYAGSGARVQVELMALPGGGARLVVADNGPGLPESRRAQPFRRFGSTSGGSGLGLAFVAAAIDQLGGAVTCESDDSGTRFTITLPG
jgi:signal transduction histidine kinase